MTVICNELDKRIKDFSDIQSYAQYDDKYVGETGYFSDRIIDFKDLNRCKKSVLVAIDDDTVTDNLFDDGEVYIQLGNAKYTNKELWNAFEYAVLGDDKCEYFDGKGWKPFGVEE